MNDELRSNEPRDELKASWLFGFLWLPLAFVPSIIQLSLGLPNWGFVTLNVVCSLVASFGFWRGLIENKALRGTLGFVVGWFLFFLNLNIVALITVLFMGLNYMISLVGCCANPPDYR